MRATRVLELHLKKELTEIERLIDAFEAAAEHAQLPANATTKVAIVLDEIVSNLIHYGIDNPLVEEPIVVKVDRLAEQLQITVSDPGPPFDPLQVPEPDCTLSIEEREIGGMGIFMVKKLMDDITYQRLFDRNILTLSLDVSAASATDA